MRELDSGSDGFYRTSFEHDNPNQLHLPDMHPVLYSRAAMPSMVEIVPVAEKPAQDQSEQSA